MILKVEDHKKIMLDFPLTQPKRAIHLSGIIEGTIEVGKRRVKNPFILEIDCDRMRKDGILIQKASKKVYVANYVPPRFIKILNKF